MRNQAIAGDSLHLGMQLLDEALRAWQNAQWRECRRNAVLANRALLETIELVTTNKACNFVIKQLTHCLDFQNNCSELLSEGELHSEIEAWRLACAFARALDIPIIVFKGVGEIGWRVSTEILPCVSEYFIVQPDDKGPDSWKEWED